jgi:hypothetical protein
MLARINNKITVQDRMAIIELGITTWYCYFFANMFVLSSMMFSVFVEVASQSLSVKAWQHTKPDFNFVWPEEDAIPSLSNRSNTALVFSGGGSRSYVSLSL